MTLKKEYSKSLNFMLISFERSVKTRLCFMLLSTLKTNTYSQLGISLTVTYTHANYYPALKTMIINQNDFYFNKKLYLLTKIINNHPVLKMC